MTPMGLRGLRDHWAGCSLFSAERLPHADRELLPWSRSVFLVHTDAKISAALKHAVLQLRDTSILHYVPHDTLLVRLPAPLPFTFTFMWHAGRTTSTPPYGLLQPSVL